MPPRATTLPATPPPFYVSPGGDEASRRLLLLAYHFPPSRAAGALRWQKFSRHAAARGIALDVITRDPAQLDAADAAQLADLGPGTRVFAVPDDEHWILGPERALRAFLAGALPRQRPRSTPSAAASSGRAAVAMRREDMRWVPRSPRDVLRAYGSWLYHAAEAVWARRALATGLRLAARHEYDAVISCGPPHMPHEAARRIGRACRIPFVMDLRDPWSLLPDLNRHYASPLWFAIAERYERRAVRGAALVVMNTQPARDAMRAAHPRSSGRIVAVMNGYDEEPLRAPRRSEQFVVAYAGSLYMNRDPRFLFRAARRVIDDLSLRPHQFRLAFMGSLATYDGTPLTRMAEEEGIGPFVTAEPAQPRSTAMEFLANATMLVNLPQDATLCIPSKVFEYMQFSAWMLALEQRESATELLLRDTRADVVAPSDVQGIATVLRRRYLEHAAGVLPAPIATNGRYSRRHQAEILFDTLEPALPDRTDGR
jgi:hypothetical protein